MAKAGTLVLVVGPSGAGKDTLIGGAREALARDSRFVFARRVVTREAVAVLEDHESVSAAEFAAREAGGAYALSWQAHGLRYGLPASLLADLEAGRVVIANGSRAVAGEAARRFARLAIVAVDAAPDIRARRLAGRGRETETQIAERLAREIDTPLEGAIRIDNSGRAEQGIARLVAALRAIAAQ